MTKFQGFWHGPALGDLRSACLTSFVSLGYSVDIYTYDEHSLPDGVVRRDANEIIPLGDIFYYENVHSGIKDLGPFSDLFRFKLLSERGGWWIDVDTVCVAPNIPSVGRAWAQQLPEIDPAAIGTGQIAFKDGDPLVLELYERCLVKSKTDFQPREALGPHLLSTVIADHGLPPNQFGTAATFYPIRFIEMFKLWLPEYRDEIRSRIKDAFFLPIFQSFPQYIGLDMSKSPPAGSFLGDICDSSHAADVARHSADEIRTATRKFFAKHVEWAPSELKAVTGNLAPNYPTSDNLFN